MGAFSHIDLDLGVTGISVLLALESLAAPIAPLIEVIDHPSFDPIFVLAMRPAPSHKVGVPQILVDGGYRAPTGTGFDGCHLGRSPASVTNARSPRRQQ
jgi:hypothetical protein